MLNFVFPAEVFYRKKQKTNHFLDDLPVFWVQKYYFTGYLPGNYSQNNTFTNSRRRCTDIFGKFSILFLVVAVTKED